MSPRHPSTSPRQISSPLLSAITSTQNPFVAGSTQHTVNAASPSPPTRYVTPHRSGDAFVPTPTHVGASPPSDAMRPRSLPHRQNSFGSRGFPQPMTPQRRPSAAGQHNVHLRGGSFAGNVPLPHEDQPHLHGALPDLDSFVSTNVGQDGGLLPGEKGLFVGFDTLSASSHLASFNVSDVLIVGYEGGLSVSRLGGGGSGRDIRCVEEIGKIEGLRGAVVEAKILTTASRRDSTKEARPLIAVILHSPLVPEAPVGNEEPSAIVTDSDSEAKIDSNPVNHDLSDASGTTWLRGYQTTVEIYSLLDQQHITTLYSSPIVDIQPELVGTSTAIPKPHPLRLDANGKFVTVSDGISGEVFIFCSQSVVSETSVEFAWRCVGKLWTTVLHRSEKDPLSSSDVDDPDSPVDDYQRVIYAPLVSLSNRWIALAPPPSAGSQISAKGVPIMSPSDPKPQGLSTATAPTPPSITCNLDAQTVGFMARLSREATQNLLKGAQWTYDRSVEAYNAYWNRSSPVQRPNSNGSGFASDHQSGNFPPTHAYGQSNGPGADAKVVAIYDLERFIDSEDGRPRNALNPVAAFPPPSGVSYISFSPGGWNLLVVNRKGDDTTLWNLMQMVHASVVPMLPDNEKEDILEPFARHAWNTTRMSEARVVDVSWVGPRGDRVAVLTDKPTVHIHDFPNSALQWPPLQKRRTKSGLQQVQQLSSDESSANGKRWSSALETFNDAVKTVRDSSRSLSISGVSGFAGGITATSTAATAKSGGKMVRQGITKGIDSIAKQAQHVYHMQDNKLHLEHPPDGIAMPGMIRLTSSLGAIGAAFNTKDRGRSGLLVIEGGSLRIHPIRQILQRHKNGPSTIRVKISKRYRKLQLPLIPDNAFPPSFISAVEAHYGKSTDDAASQPGGADVCTRGVQPNGYWALRASKAVSSLPAGTTENWHTIMEAESNPPFQPFYFHRRYIQHSFSPAPARPLSPTRSKVHSTDTDVDGAVGPYNDADQDSYDARSEADPQKEVDRPDWEALEHDALLKHHHHVTDSSKWLFGAPVTGRKVRLPLSLTHQLLAGGGGAEDGSEGDLRDEIMENRITVEDDGEGAQIVVMTIRRRQREDEFFEDGAEVVDFVE